MAAGPPLLFRVKTVYNVCWLGKKILQCLLAGLYPWAIHHGTLAEGDPKKGGGKGESERFFLGWSR